ncbi:hypothetical protein [Candidatus Mycoplasma haematohominis]|uniref:Uncharacterized protein n=1 Tax=Candidatus Mycoplasma haematohominis TaxID=1494318 RepID=A0A478FR26_9MOLU|nr:hypothetical protein [Candidatus Mycoplasma haemohominis]GCE64048.1 hypothetical protein MHSWG343_10560 [Candidatus Mycoplasma haemohominis]
MSTQAIGAAAAGTLVIGGGGTLAAYAAGAFNGESTYDSFQAYFDAKLSETYTYTGNHSDLKNKMKVNLTGSDKETYKSELKKIISKEVVGESVLDTDVDGAESDDTKLGKVYGKAKTWCEATKAVKLTPTQNKKWNEANVQSHEDWAPFMTVCLEKKPS